METEEENAIIAALDYRDEYNPGLSPAAVLASARRKQTRARLTLSGAALAAVGVAAGAVLTVGGTSGSGAAADVMAAGKNDRAGQHSPVIKLSPGQRFTVPGPSGATIWFTGKSLCVTNIDSPTFETGDCAPGYAFGWVGGTSPTDGNTVSPEAGPFHMLGSGIVAAPGANGYVYGMTLAAVKPTLVTVTGGDGKAHVATIVEAVSGQPGLLFFTPKAITTAADKAQQQLYSGPLKVKLFSASGARVCTIDPAPPAKNVSLSC
ncbi:hypothetical protein [Catenulispora rubra]|uniref:hypothetical protein n=1 Tax=Catenulispora rubra TaxID=280293 RepID=UPI0018925F3F|nr:hypothetical protein [Catenulispora rubra]